MDLIAIKLFSVLMLLLSVVIRVHSHELPTVTVRGFLNFRTTVDGTVIVFTPASASGNHQDTTSSAIKSSPLPSSSIFSPSPATFVRPLPSSSRVVSISSSSVNRWPSLQVTATPVLSQRPAVTSSPIYPTGLVTVLGGTVVNNGLTTVYETKVIGTYIEGKYAQILKSSSLVNQPRVHSGLIDIIPTRTFAGLWPTATATADLSPQFVPQIEPALAKPELEEVAKPSAPVFDGGSNALPTSYRNRDRVTGRAVDATSSLISRPARLGRTEARLPWDKSAKDKAGEVGTTTPVPVKLRRPFRAGTSRPGRFSWTPRATDRVRLNRFKIKPVGVAGGTQKDKEEEEAAKEINQRLARRLGVTRQVPKEPEARPITEPTVMEVLPVERREESSLSLSADSRPVYNPPIFDTFSGDEQEVSAIDPHRVVKEVQTVTSELTRDVSGVLKVDTVTFTTTVERTLDPSEAFPTDGILGSTIQVEGNDLDASTIQETPPVVISRTYSVTERSQRTSLVPVFDGTSTVTHTVTERFVIRKLITAYKTMPPGDLLLLQTASMDMNNSSHFLENLTEGEANLEPSLFEGKLLMTATADASGVQPTELVQLQSSLNGQQPSFNSFNGQGSPQLQSVDLNNPLVLGAALRNPNLAAMYFGLQQLGQQATQYTTIVKPTEYLTTETVFNTKTLSFYDGRQTRTRTITEPGSTIERTVTTTTTEVSQVINPQFAVQQAQLQRIFATQLASHGITGQFNNQQNNQQNNGQFNNQQNNGGQFNNGNQNPFNQQYNNNQQQYGGFNNGQFNNNNGQFGNGQFNNGQFGQNNNVQPSTVTSQVTTVLTTTQTNTKIYTLVYNALSTKYRTVTSTSIFPTTVTTLTTQTIANTANYGNFFG